MLDSMSFLPTSLQNLVDTLSKSSHKFEKVQRLVNDWKGCKAKEQGVKLLLRKGVYPYSFATSILTLEMSTSLPPKEAFYNDLQEHYSTPE
jgi:hypothetical protein